MPKQPRKSTLKRKPEPQHEWARKTLNRILGLNKKTRVRNKDQQWLNIVADVTAMKKYEEIMESENDDY